MKHIESILPEHAADELTQLLLDDDTVSSALKDFLHRETGCDIPLINNIPSSDIEEMIPLCLSILRRFWNTPLTALGDGIKKQSISDFMRQTIGDRVQGNEAWSIPPANANIPTTVSALLARKIDAGFDECPDGISLAQVIGSDIAITEMHDTNKGWTMSKAFANGFPNAKKVTLGCKTLHASPSSMFPNAEEFDFPELDHIDTGESGHPQVNLFYGAHIKRINMPEVTQLRVVNASYMGLFYNITSPCEILTPKCTSVVSAFDNNYPRLFHSTPGVYKWVLGKIKNANNLMTNGDFVNLIHFEIGEGTAVSLNLKYWTATNVLSNPEFLSNFQTYIADRLADMTGNTALTLTLSSAVYAALEAQEGQTILATLTNKNWTVKSA